MFQNYDIINEEVLIEHRNSEYGTFPENRNVEEYIRHGFLLLDKPAGPTSHDVVSTVKKILGISKAGHSGTLDPKVTGVLPIGLEEGTKILTALKGSDKQYLCNFRLSKSISEIKLGKFIEKFHGIIYQYPPLKSNVVRRLRKRKINSIELLEVREKEALLLIDCQAGTYIRTLCVDMGRAIGIKGYMKELRRTRSGTYDETQVNTLHNLFDAYEDYKDGYGDNRIKQIVCPLEEAIEHIPKIIVNDFAVDPICHGANLAVPGVLALQEFDKNELIGIMTAKGELICLGDSLRSSSYIHKHSSGYIAKPNRVILKRGIYPKYLS